MQPKGQEIPDQIRAAADQSVEQARRAFEQFMDATQKAVAQAEGQARTVGEGAADLGRQSLAYVEENIATAFDYARRIVQARTLEEMAALQREFVERQMAVVTEQGKALGSMFGRSADAASKANGTGGRAGKGRK